MTDSIIPSKSLEYDANEVEILHRDETYSAELVATRGRMKVLEEQISRLLVQDQSTQLVHENLSKGYREALELITLQMKTAKRIESLAVKSATNLSIDEIISEWPRMVDSKASLIAQLNAAHRSVRDLTDSIISHEATLDELRQLKIANDTMALELGESSALARESQAEVRFLNVDRGRYARSLKSMTAENLTLRSELDNVGIELDATKLNLESLKNSQSYRFTRMVANDSKSFTGILRLFWKVPNFIIKLIFKQRKR